MESLLTPSESLVFQSFLSSIDSPAPDWVFYSPAANDPPDFSVPQAQGREALAKATKDLMSLDAGRWHPAVAAHHPRRPQQYHHPYNSQRHQPLRPQIGGQQQHHASISHDPFPFIHANKHPQYQRALQQRVMHDPSAQPMSNTVTSPYPLPLAMPSGTDGLYLSSGDSPTSPGTSSATTSTPHYAPSSAATEARSPRPSSRRPSKRQQLPSSLSSEAQKQNLLSPSQKKANHIQSEQKRRANIRKGYDALCETVPALREGIREEEEREAEARMNAGARANGRNGSTGRSKKGKKKEGDDKTDGRAGPRSENVVLSKTIDYISELLSERQGLLSRLQHARSILPPGHPALVPPVQQPLWEREWKGGEGKYDAKAGEADEEEEEEESS